MPISGHLVQEKAAEYPWLLGHKKCQASSGWLDKFEKRYCMASKIISEERNSVPEEDCSFWKEKVLENCLKDYEPDRIFNMDKTELFSNDYQNKALTFKNYNCYKGKIKIWK